MEAFEGTGEVFDVGKADGLRYFAEACIGGKQKLFGKIHSLFGDVLHNGDAELGFEVLGEGYGAEVEVAGDFGEGYFVLKIIFDVILYECADALAVIGLCCVGGDMFGYHTKHTEIRFPLAVGDTACQGNSAVEFRIVYIGYFLGYESSQRLFPALGDTHSGDYISDDAVGSDDGDYRLGYTEWAGIGYGITGGCLGEPLLVGCATYFCGSTEAMNKRAQANATTASYGYAMEIRIEY